jgi:hypothetical protein
MGAQLTYGTAGATGGGFAALKYDLQPAMSDVTARFPVNDWQRRAPLTWKDRNQWVSLWPRGQFGSCGTDGTDAYMPHGMDDGGMVMYEPFSCDGAGTQTLKFLKGTCVDTSDAALSGVEVQAFRTSDDAFAGYVVQSRTDGSYDLATNFPGVNHYVVAYLSGSPDRGGTTANTLVPTNIDGS